MMNKKLLAAVLLIAALPAPAQAKPAKMWWCGPSGTTNLTPLFRIVSWTCDDGSTLGR